MLTLGEFKYKPGNLVALESGWPILTVVWRAKFLGLDKRTYNVYQVNNEYWDVYFEDELYSALRAR
ncbi:hypothetical protein SAMN06265337_0611 [Hymenobacter gelipurpurascens]|uniref:Uncharacterized protein n=1 Tax=Hymenobacter gelipurpurascens TaxID=89968 RepID=A0A212T7U9_9BACT|nr:hypothetical protein [Hymenobacter gelipurpurascens]SNC62137.1 hypothetical protein SAMN06265337_0611 [Hymenobacter gelipurpurascens]